jgi:hypothetical protein
MKLSKPPGPDANPADKSSPGPPAGNPCHVGWLPVPTPGALADQAWINIQRSPTDLWCFPRHRLIGCTWANPPAQVLQLEFTTHTIEVQAAATNPAKELAEGILEGRISTLLADSSQPLVRYPDTANLNHGTIKISPEPSTHPAYELLPEDP